MKEQLQLFELIRGKFCKSHTDITEGKMMSVEAIKYKGKVFAFISTSGNMVFKLGKAFDPANYNDLALTEFNPFKNKGPLKGWFELDFQYKDQYEAFTEIALDVVK